MLLPSRYRSTDPNGWIYQYPDQDKPAYLNLPDFTDDPKSVTLKRSLTENETKISTKVFINDILPSTPDFVDAKAGLFVLAIHSNRKSMPATNISFFPAHQECLLELKNLLNISDTADSEKALKFNSETRTIESTGKLVELFKTYNVEPTTISIKYEPLKKGIEKKQGRPAINVIQVKRRKKV
jgi:hypothetical protein